MGLVNQTRHDVGVGLPSRADLKTVVTGGGKRGQCICKYGSPMECLGFLVLPLGFEVDMDTDTIGIFPIHS